MTYIVAEIGCNHQGSMDQAKDMIEMAAESGADYVKFQKRDIASQYRHFSDQYSSPHPAPENSFGNTYREHREFLEFNKKQHRELKKYCK